MSNLGAYQWITSTSKKVGGPINLLLLTGATGAITGTVAYKLSEISVKKLIKAIKAHHATKDNLLDSNKQIYSVTSLGISNEGVNFPVGSQYRVLEIDGDSVLIEKIGDENNPYFVSKVILGAISDFKE